MRANSTSDSTSALVPTPAYPTRDFPFAFFAFDFSPASSPRAIPRTPSVMMLSESSPVNPRSLRARCDDLGRAVLLFALGVRNWLSSAGTLFPMPGLYVVSPAVWRPRAVRPSRGRFCEEAPESSSGDGSLLCLATELPLPTEGVWERDVAKPDLGDE